MLNAASTQKLVHLITALWSRLSRKPTVTVHDGEGKGIILYLNCICCQEDSGIVLEHFLLFIRVDTLDICLTSYN